jgi:hypothetical protein
LNLLKTSAIDVQSARVFASLFRVTLRHFKMTIFQKIFDDFMSHIIKKNAGKKIKSLLNFSPLKTSIIKL